MGNSRFNFDLYVDELLTEALSLTQMQDQLKQAGLDPTKYDQKHFLFLVGLINSNQGIEIYDELLSKIKDKGLLGSLMSVSVNDRRSDKPTIDTEKVGKALEHPDDPNELRAIIAGQRKEIPAEKQEPEYDAFGLKRFLSFNQGLNLFNILVKIKPELDNTLKQFLSEYNNEAPEVQEFLKTNAQRAKTVQDLIAILHEGHTKNINPYNSTTSLTLDDLRQGALFSNEKEHLYIIRTTFQDEFNKSIRWNLKYGQGNRFGLCISSKTNNYYLGYRTGEMGDSSLTTYFVYKLHDKSLDSEDINNYEMVIIDAMGPNSNLFSYNIVAKVWGVSQMHIHGRDGLKWEFNNHDTPNQSSSDVIDMMYHMFYSINRKTRTNTPIKVLSRDNKKLGFNEKDFSKIFSVVPLGPKEKDVKYLLDKFDEDEFMRFDDSEKIALLSSGNICDRITKEIFLKLSTEVRNHYIKVVDQSYKDRYDIYEVFSDAERNIYNKRMIKEVNDRIENIKKTYYIEDDDFDKIINYHPINSFQYKIAITDPKLRKIYVDAIEENNRKIRNAVLSKVGENGVYRGDLILRGDEFDRTLRRIDSSVFSPRYVLPDLSDIIVDGHFTVSYKDLTSLKGCPKVITETFECIDNDLETLEFGPKCAFRYKASYNKLVSLKGAPELVSDFYVEHNNLTSLEGCPIIGRSLNLYDNKLTSLKGCAEIIPFEFEVRGNKLKSLKYGPKSVGGLYSISINPLESLEGFTFDTKYPISKITYKDYEMLFRTELKLDYDDAEERTKLSARSESLMLQISEKLLERMDAEKNIAMQEYKAKKQINKESLLYNLMKSYLLRS